MTISLKKALYTALAQEVLAETKVIIANVQHRIVAVENPPTGGPQVPSPATNPQQQAKTPQKKTGPLAYPKDLPEFSSQEFKTTTPGGKIRKLSTPMSVDEEASMDMEKLAQQTNYIQNTIKQFTDLTKQLASKTPMLKKEMYDLVKYMEDKFYKDVQELGEPVRLQDIKDLSEVSHKLEQAMRSIWRVLMEIENAEDISLRMRGKSEEAEKEYMKSELPSLKSLDEALELSAKDTKTKQELKPFFEEVSKKFRLEPSELKKKKLSPAEEKELQDLENKYLKKSQFFSAPSWFSKIREKFGKQKQEAPAASLMLARTLVRAAVLLSQ